MASAIEGESLKDKYEFLASGKFFQFQDVMDGGKNITFICLLCPAKKIIQASMASKKIFADELNYELLVHELWLFKKN